MVAEEQEGGPVEVHDAVASSQPVSRRQGRSSFRADGGLAGSGPVGSLRVPVARPQRRALVIGGSAVLLAGLVFAAVAFGRFDEDVAGVVTSIDADAADDVDIPSSTVVEDTVVVVPLAELGDGSSGVVRGVSAGAVRFVAHRTCLQANGFDIDLFEPPSRIPGLAPAASTPPPDDLPWRQLTAEERPVAEAATKACRDLQPGRSEERRWQSCLDQQGSITVEIRGNIIPPDRSLEQARAAGEACRSQRPANHQPSDERSRCLDAQGAWLVPLPYELSREAEAACAEHPLLLAADVHAMCLIDNGLPGVGIGVVVDVAVARAAAPPCLHLGPGGNGPGDRCMADRGIFTWLPVTVNWPEGELAAALQACAQVDQVEADLVREHAQQVETQLRTCLGLAGVSYENVHEQIEADPQAREAYTRCESELPPLPPPRAWTEWERCLAGSGLAVPYDPAVIPLASVRRALGACLHLEDAALEARAVRNSQHF